MSPSESGVPELIVMAPIFVVVAFAIWLVLGEQRRPVAWFATSLAALFLFLAPYLNRVFDAADPLREMRNGQDLDLLWTRGADGGQVLQIVLASLSVGAIITAVRHSRRSTSRT